MADSMPSELDTLLLAMPVSWKGTLQQYAGWLHRQQAGKTSVRIIDWLDLGHPLAQRMWERSLQDHHQGKQIVAGNHRDAMAHEHRQLNARNPGA